MEGIAVDSPTACDEAPTEVRRWCGEALVSLASGSAAMVFFGLLFVTEQTVWFVLLSIAAVTGGTTGLVGTVRCARNLTLRGSVAALLGMMMSAPGLLIDFALLFLVLPEPGWNSS